jgi:hypothetical protein
MMKNDDKMQKDLNKLVYKAHVPKGLRPETNEDIDAMLDAIGGDKYTDEKVQRMMRKIKGQIPLHSETENMEDSSYEEMTEQENELLAMHRDGSEEISTDSQKILDEMRKRARIKDEDAEDEKE